MHNLGELETNPPTPSYHKDHIDLAMDQHPDDQRHSNEMVDGCPTPKADAKCGFPAIFMKLPGMQTQELYLCQTNICIN